MLPKERKYFVTGNAVFEGRIPLLVLIPHSQVEWLYLTFFGALQYMGDVASWFTGGETTPDEAAEIFTEVLNGARPMLFLIGMISDFAAPIPDDSGWLQCDGTNYLIADFPDLFAVIGTIYNTGSTPVDYFSVPDLRGRVRATLNSGETRLPSFANVAGGAGGESDHTLITAEMPSHSHSDTGHAHVYSMPVATIVNGGVEAPAPSATVIPGITDAGFANLTSTGGDGAHNNVQPTMALYTYILAKF